MNRKPLYISLLHAEFERRTQKNSRYSLRAFARSVELDAGTLSRIFSGKQELSPRACTRVVRALNLPGEERDAFVGSYMDNWHRRETEKLQALFGSGTCSGLSTSLSSGLGASTPASAM